MKPLFYALVLFLLAASIPVAYNSIVEGQEDPHRTGAKTTFDLSAYYQFKEGSNWTYSSKSDVLGDDADVLMTLDNPAIISKVAKFKDGVTFFEHDLALYAKDGFIVVGKVTQDGSLVAFARAMKIGMNETDKWDTYVEKQENNLTSSFVGHGAVETPAGKFNTICIKVTFNENNHAKYWYASKVGLVKVERFDKLSPDHPTVRTVHILEKYEIK